MKLRLALACSLASLLIYAPALVAQAPTAPKAEVVKAATPLSALQTAKATIAKLELQLAQAQVDKNGCDVKLVAANAGLQTLLNAQAAGIGSTFDTDHTALEKELVTAAGGTYPKDRWDWIAMTLKKGDR